MILPRNIRPEKSLYAIGASTLKIISESESEISFDGLYKQLITVYPIRISYSYFLYSLDWLFLVGLVELNGDKNKLKKCF